MKHQNTDPDHHATDHHHARAVRYRWTMDGIVCTGHTVITSTTRAGLRSAIRRFWHQNTHVQPDLA